MVYLYWRGRVKLWEGGWAEFHLLLRKEKGSCPALDFLFTLSLWLHFLPWSSCGAHQTPLWVDSFYRLDRKHLQEKSTILFCWGQELNWLNCDPTGVTGSARERTGLHGQDWWRRNSQAVPQGLQEERAGFGFGVTLRSLNLWNCELWTFSFIIQRDNTLLQIRWLFPRLLG